MHGASALPYSVWRALRKESSQFLDVVFQSLPTGYGDKEHNAYSRRALYQMHWAVRNQADLDFFLRIDDDSFLCLHRLTYEMRSLPGEQFFWGKFWCNEGRNRADENFMLFSRDLINLLADDTYVSRLLPFDNEVTLGWNFGYWSWILNMTIFDDQKRIDAQQGYLTRYMHNDTLAEIPDFCEDHIYAHHVSAGIMKKAFEKVETHMMYPLPLRENGFACKGEKSFVPARHSEKLPNVKITHADAS